LGESRLGLIMHWELFEQTAPQDARLVRERLAPIEDKLQIKLKEVGADCGFDSQANQRYLAAKKATTTTVRASRVGCASGCTRGSLCACSGAAHKSKGA
jgi:hypothetical protein